MERSDPEKKQNSDNRLNLIVLVCAVVTAFIGGIILLAWAFGANDMISMGKKFIPMADESALLFMISGIVLAFIRNSHQRLKLQYFIFGSAAFIIVISMLAIIDFATDYIWSLSNFLGQSHSMKEGIPTGRISVLTAFCFISISIALLLLLGKAKKISVIFSFLSFFIGYIIAVGYIYGVPFFYNGTKIPMAWPTAILFMISSIGCFMASGKETFPLNFFLGDSTSARLLRVLLPSIFIILQIQDFIEALNSEKYNSSFALINSITDICTVLISAIIIFILCRSVGDSIDLDMTEHILANEAIQEKSKELHKSKEQAEENDRLKSAFLANMSHEIRTPMNGILGFAELLKEPNLPTDELQEYISIIEKSGARMLNIINDIIDISKIESGQMKVDNKESEINEQIEYVYTFFKPEVEGKGMQFFFNNTLPSVESIIKTDREKVFAILTNLVKNAIKYSDKGTIEVGYVKKGEYLEFFVKDQGIGIPKERQEAIFHRFVQADTSDKRAYQGAGLGLAITKAYVEMLGGKIWVESEEGKGSIFYFTLPYIIKTEEKAALTGLIQKYFNN